MLNSKRTAKAALFPALALCVLLLLSGCGASSANDVSVCIAPESFGGESVVPKTAPSAALPERDKPRRTMPVYLYDAADGPSETVYTANMRYLVEGHYFVGEELTFALPEGWNANNLELRISEQKLSGYPMRQFFFYLTDSESSQAALIMKIDAVSGDFQREYGVDYGERLGASYDGAYVYLRAAVAGGAPDGFADAELYERTLAAITAEGYIIQINV